MSPDERLLVQAYVDGELDAASALSFEQRLRMEPGLAREQERLLALRRRLRESSPTERAPERLLAAMASIGGPPPGATTAGPTRVAWPRARRLGAAEWRLALAACLVGGLAGAALTTVLQAPLAREPVTSEVVADHLRAVMAPQPFDVASSDQHTVKPWFTGRLPFAPRVFDLAAGGFPLAGGRVDILGGQPAATLVFRHGKHLISLTSQPVSNAATADRDGGNARGFLVRTWLFGGLKYWAVSDIGTNELDSFEALAQAALASD